MNLKKTLKLKSGVVSQLHATTEWVIHPLSRKVTYSCARCHHKNGYVSAHQLRNLNDVLVAICVCNAANVFMGDKDRYLYQTSDRIWRMKTVSF